jgi:hypothetical protein
MHSAQPLKFVTRQLAGHAGKACLHPRHALLKRPQHRGLRALSHGRRKTETAVIAHTQAGHLSDFGRRPKPSKAAVCRLTKSITPTERKEPW